MSASLSPGGSKMCVEAPITAQNCDGQTGAMPRGKCQTTGSNPLSFCISSGVTIDIAASAIYRGPRLQGAGYPVEVIWI